MATTPKSNILDIDLSKIKDEPTKEAMNGLIRFVTDLFAIGVKVDGSMSAKDMTINSKAFAVDAVGNVAAASFATTGAQIGGDGYSPIKQFKMKAFFGKNGASASTTIHADGSVIGVTGWTQSFGSSWHPMHQSGAIAGANYVGASSPSDYNKIKITNADGVNSNSYRLMVFYTD